MQRQQAATPAAQKLKRPPELSAHREGTGGGGGGGDEWQLPTRRKMKAAGKPTSSGTSGDLRRMLQDFLEQQHRLDAQRQDAMERHAQERLAFERQWRQSMLRLERERLLLEQAWMEREEQRRVREEARAERTAALLTTLLNRLLQDDL
ncbi:hypothetical protein GUJ93_ZPchr0006g46447 [Zizania palustris]|uniref:Uncharacterized protein n=1 Tax=Zizania palustris TaxID=103762 RepID=A0A8J5R317_ZIZPA|nr:hypothetical protein GUJ93_ZPchr0151g33456 [Zizania palustris]KAG8072003.1 hypothetical protein GUJ93_ZPchr0006g46447 [Zizania palustris]